MSAADNPLQAFVAWLGLVDDGHEDVLEDLLAKALGLTCASAVNRGALHDQERRWLLETLEAMPWMRPMVAAMLLHLPEAELLRDREDQRTLELGREDQP